jgi:hypothetical protein
MASSHCVLCVSCAQLATHAVVYAQLVLDKTEHGVHIFMVQVSERPSRCGAVQCGAVRCKAVRQRAVDSTRLVDALTQCAVDSRREPPPSAGHRAGRCRWAAVRGRGASGADSGVAPPLERTQGGRPGQRHGLHAAGERAHSARTYACAPPASHGGRPLRQGGHDSFARAPALRRGGAHGSRYRSPRPAGRTSCTTPQVSATSSTRALPLLAESAPA